MITFYDCSDIWNILNNIKPISKTVSEEKLSAYTCIQIKQLDKLRTEFTIKDPKAGFIAKRVFKTKHPDSCWGVPGTEFLVYYDEFEEAIKKFHDCQQLRISLVQEKSGLFLYVNYRYEEEELKYDHANSVRLYPGDLADFDTYTPKTPTLVCTLLQSQLDYLVELLRWYNANEFIEITFKADNTINLFAPNDLSRSCYLDYKFEGSVTNEATAYINKTLLQKALKIAEPENLVDIYINDEFVHITNTENSSWIKMYTSTSEQADAVTKSRKIIEKLNKNFEYNGSRVVYANALKNALVIQKSSKLKDTCSDLLLIPRDDEVGLSVVLSSNINYEDITSLDLIEESKVGCSELDGEWHWVGFIADPIIKIVECCISYLRFQSCIDTKLELKQYKLEQAKGVHWLVSFTLPQEPNLSIYYLAKDGSLCR